MSRAMDRPTELATSLGIEIGDTDCTSFPFWMICRKTKRRGHVYPVAHGVWLSRASAEAHRVARLYEYGRESFVYCFSGTHSADWRAISDALRTSEVTR